jgi:outer membrane protein assembly factor BamE (lipoprotein component of BamABCDE complex)
MAGRVRIGAVVAAAVLATGCSSIVNHKGYLADEVVLRSVQPGVDNRTSVERTLGQPSFISQFGEPVWYYVSSTTSQKPFTTPKIVGQSVLAVRFDAAGNVIAADRTGLDLVAYISPDDDETPTLGRERGFLQDLFGNIGQVGSGAGASSNGGGGGGG